MSAPVGLSRATRRRRALAALLAAITSVTTPVAAHAQDGARTERPIVRGAAVAPDAVVRLYVPAGTVRVTTWERDSVAVRGTTAPAVTVFGAGTRHAIKLGVEPATPGDTRLARADWVVTVPRRARLWVKMIDGAIETAGVQGEQELYAVTGRITVRDARGTTSIESIDAPVTLTAVSGDTRVRGGRGAVVATDITGTLSLGTVSGDATLVRAAAMGRVETVGGAIAIDAPRLDGATLELQTHAGTVTLALAADAAPTLDLAPGATVRGARLRPAAGAGLIVARSFRGAIVIRPAVTVTRR